MTARVHRLPDPMSRQWLVFEAEVRRVMRARGHPQDEIAHALQVLEPIYKRCARPHRVTIRPDSGDDALRSVSDWVSDFGTALLLEIVYRELELLRAGLRC